MLRDSYGLAIDAIGRNLLRSGLTLLGIVIGVAAVIAMVTVGAGSSAKIQTDIAKLGSNMLIVRPGQESIGPPGGSSEQRYFKERDIAVLRANLTGARALAPSANRSLQVVNGSSNYEATITGTDLGYFAVHNWPVAEGRLFNDAEMRSGASVCVIGETIRRELFVGASPIGQRLRVGKFSCQVIGALAERGQSAFGNDQDAVAILPLRAYHRRVAGDTRIASINISVAESDRIREVRAEAVQILREIRRIGPGADDDFTVRDMTQMASTLASTSAVMTGLLGAVAAVSLLVGGIGIMNIMLVSVTERTREIGIRLAVGALERQVLLQFLVEAAVLALIGGLIGAALGLALAALASFLMDIPFSPSAGIVIVALVFSGAIGLAFGYFPARRAARLDPIEALRHE